MHLILLPHWTGDTKLANSLNFPAWAVTLGKCTHVCMKTDLGDVATDEPMHVSGLEPFTEVVGNCGSAGLNGQLQDKCIAF